MIDRQMTECVRLKRRAVPDGQGGFAATWTEGARFRAAVVKERSSPVRRAEKQDVTSVYTVTAAPGAGLAFHDVFRRARDGAVFRVISRGEDSRPPEEATFDFEQAAAERWSLPDA